MIFTLVTIIFLPLSFIASIFGMNAAELNDGAMSLSSEFRLMFPISAGIILTSFLFAFSQTVFNNSIVALARSAVSFVWNTTVTWVLVKTGMYVAGREMAARANRLREREGKVTGGMKAEVLRREKNLERMRAAGHVRELVRKRALARVSGEEGGDGGEQSSTGLFSPYGASIPGSPSPFLGSRGHVGGGGPADLDVEMGERVSRQASSQRQLVPGRPI